MTIHRALSSGTMSDRVTCLYIIRKFASALVHVHDVGFLHNDIKANNVLLDIVDGAFNPVIIDFGKTLPMGSAKGPKVMSQEKQKKYMEDFPRITPEIVAAKVDRAAKVTSTVLEKLLSVFFVKQISVLPQK